MEYVALLVGGYIAGLITGPKLIGAYKRFRGQEKKA